MKWLKYLGVAANTIAVALWVVDASYLVVSMWLCIIGCEVGLLLASQEIASLKRRTQEVKS